MFGTHFGLYSIVAPLGAGGSPPFARPVQRANDGEVSSAFAAKRLLRDRAEARSELDPSGGGPMPRSGLGCDW